MSDQIRFTSSISSKSRRKFLQYLVGGGIGTLALGFFPEISQSYEVDLETLCSLFPYNSRCQDYLPGVRALDSKKNPIQVDALLPTAKPETPIAVSGLPDQDPVYLVIKTGPKIAEYGLRPICTHRGCTVDWKADSQQFVCPCHGSKYDAEGRVVHGPAKRPLPLLTVVVKQNQIRLVSQAPAIDPR